MEKFDVIKLLSDENRFNIFMKLLEYESLCVGEIEQLVGLKQSNASKHIRKFKDFDILDSTREKNMIRYKIRESFLSENMSLIKYLIN